MQWKNLLTLKKAGGQVQIFDPIRKRFMVQTPEEVVRQLVQCYLIAAKNYPIGRIRVEKELLVNTLTKRCDILVYGWDMGHYLLVECKAPQVKISQDTFHQIANYNLSLRVKYLLVTNGIQTFCCEMSYGEAPGFKFLTEVPSYPAHPIQ